MILAAIFVRSEPLRFFFVGHIKGQKIAIILTETTS